MSAVSRRPVETKDPGNDHEHPLLGMPRRDTVVTAVLAVATVAFFTLMATDAGRRLIQPIDDAFLRWIVSVRTGWPTMVAHLFNLVGLTYVMTPIRLGIAGWLAFDAVEWWQIHRPGFNAIGRLIAVGGITGSIGVSVDLGHHRKNEGQQ